MMNAIILAAGNSSRMKRDGYNIPKPLLPILGVPNSKYRENNNNAQ